MKDALGVRLPLTGCNIGAPAGHPASRFRTKQLCQSGRNWPDSSPVQADLNERNVAKIWMTAAGREREYEIAPIG